jgi:alpha-tubulin suppressor-like RCC1 family protein
VLVSPGELTLVVGESQQLNASPQDEEGNPITGLSVVWSSSAETVATVSASGVVMGVAAGSTTISATVEGKAGTATVSVTPEPSVPVALVSVSPPELTFVQGGSQQFNATPQDEAGNALFGRAIAWTTSDPSVATVSETGLVNGLGVGAATITATSEGKSGTAEVSISVVTFTATAAGGAHTCALTTDGATYCWGRGESGQLGVPVPMLRCTTDAGPYPCSSAPVQVRGAIAFMQLALGGAHTCGLTSDGSAYCWGSNGDGQLGHSTQSYDTPTPVDTDLKFTSLDAGAQHTCGLTSSGTAFCWGRNDRGQLGDGTTDVRSVPQAVTGDHTFQLIVAGGFNIGHTCALTNDGDAYCWGDNERGQLGNGDGGFGQEDLAPHPVPAPVVDAPTFVSLTAGLGRHICGLTSTGDAYCWGENSFGALGDRTTGDKAEPVPVYGGLEFSLVIAGGYIGHTCALTTGAAAYCWGENSVGQIGDNSLIDRLAPAAVFGGHSFTTLDSGFRHTCGLTTTGTLYCWGSGGAGQLGTGSDTQESVPTKVVGQP